MGIARQLHAEGATIAFTYLNEVFEKRVRPLAEGLGSELILRCDVQNDAEVEGVFSEIEQKWGSLDFVVHSIAYAGREELRQPFSRTSREGFRTALEVSAYSLVAVTRGAVPLMTNGGSVVTLTYLGSQRAMPNYNVMGVAKAALEATVRYLAAELGEKAIRVNAISGRPRAHPRCLGHLELQRDLRDHGEPLSHAPLRHAGRGGKIGVVHALGSLEWRDRRDPLRRHGLQHRRVVALSPATLSAQLHDRGESPRACFCDLEEPGFSCSPVGLQDRARDSHSRGLVEYLALPGEAVFYRERHLDTDRAFRAARFGPARGHQLECLHDHAGGEALRAHALFPGEKG